MPRFLMHLENDLGTYDDDNGREYASVEQAIDELGRAAGSILTDEVAEGRSPVTIVAYVEDERGRRVAVLTVNAELTRDLA